MSNEEGHVHARALTSGARHRKPLLIAFCLTGSYMLVEFIVGFSIGSLALLSDAAHMGTDVLGLGMALAAITLASRKTTTQRTYGFYRLEVLAALANGILLFAVAGYVLWQCGGQSPVLGRAGRRVPRMYSATPVVTKASARLKVGNHPLCR